MSKGAGAVGDNSLAITGKAQQQSGDAAGTLIPTYQKFALNPQGLTPQQKSNMLTATGESIGGATAGIVGQGGLQAARTRNAGATDTALADAARTGDQKFSDVALGVENQDAMLQRQQQQQGLQGLQNIYSGANGTSIDALGQYNQARGIGNQFTGQMIKYGLQAAGAPVSG